MSTLTVRRSLRVGAGAALCLAAALFALARHGRVLDAGPGRNGSFGSAAAATGGHPAHRAADRVKPRKSGRYPPNDRPAPETTDGSGVAGIVLGESTADDVVERFGPPSRVEDHNGFSLELHYARTGLSFYHLDTDPDRKIFCIRVGSPYRLRTEAGITLGESTMDDVLEAYGKLDWATTDDGEFWWSEHDGIQYRILRDPSVVQFPLDEEHYRGRRIVEIALDNRYREADRAREDAGEAPDQPGPD